MKWEWFEFSWTHFSHFPPSLLPFPLPSLAYMYVILCTSCGTPPSSPLQDGGSRTVLEDYHYGPLCEQLVPCMGHWETIAINLGFKAYEIEKIRLDLQRSLNKTQLYGVIQTWLLWGPGDARGTSNVATLEELQSALNRANLARVVLTLPGGSVY